jgi:hypothetical protein
MTKKLFTLLLAVAASVGTMFAWDYEDVPIGDLYYNLDATNQTAGVTSSSGSYSGDIVIPSSVTYNSVSYIVTSIGSSAFADCTGLTSVTIPNSVTSISYAAFYKCTGLTSVTIGNSVTSIGDWAFKYCSGLTSVTIGNSVTSIGEGAFEWCTGLTSVTIGNSVTSIGSNAFSGCGGLNSVTINSPDIVGKTYASSYNIKNIFGSQVTQYIIGNSVTSIGGGAFYECTGLTSVTIPNSVTGIGDDAFGGCTGLTSVSIPNSVTSIGEAAFYGCSGLTSVTIPNSVTSIGGGAFAYCTGLTSVTIGNSVISIGDYAFSGCDGLTSVTIPNSVTSIGGGAFYECTGLTSVTIPNSVTGIGEYAFAECTGLTSVTIGNSVTSIGDWAFYNCTGLTSISNYANTPQKINSYVFFYVHKSTCRLYVPLNSVDLYKAAYGWKEFKQILPISAKETETTETTVETTETSAEITWSSVSGAYTYELIIKDKSGNIICTLVFDSEGRLKSITFLAPSRNRALQQSQTAGFSFTVNNLNSGSTYTYTLTAKDAGDNILDTESGSFTTTGEGVPTAIDNIDSSSLQGGDRGRLIYRNGQILILRGDKIYTLQGQEVK